MSRQSSVPVRRQQWNSPDIATELLAAGGFFATAGLESAIRPMAAVAMMAVGLMAVGAISSA
ncbi:hypothetical protein [Arthrobacter sp. N199823]|uniref:hypothetical protein n=1 Tax=Arthrobacter sp. N199823 TaxID=2058895 RepID=UPI000CE4C25B|nr:hypothetical protein [Arthrobacter sp. N199823]